jgi:hypothetical protein
MKRNLRKTPFISFHFFLFPFLDPGFSKGYDGKK